MAAAPAHLRRPASPTSTACSLDPALRLLAGDLHAGAYTETEHLAGATARIEAPFLVSFDPVVLARR